MTLFEADEAVSRVRDEVDGTPDILVGAIFDDALKGSFKVSVVAAGLDGPRGIVPRSMTPELFDTRGFDDSEPASRNRCMGWQSGIRCYPLT